MTISRTLVGRELPETTLQWDADDVILYALGVGARPPVELSLLDESQGPAVLPTFALIANWWAVRDIRAVVDAGPHPMVHASQFLELHRPIPPAGEIRTQARVSALWDKGRNTLVELTSEGGDDQGPLFTARSATMILGLGGWGGERGPASPSEPDGGTEPALVHEDSIRAEQAAIYRLSGDRNPLHIDPEAAKKAGFDDVFLHGLCTLGFAARALVLRTADGVPARLRSIGCRFAAPVGLDGPLRTEMWPGSDGAVRFRSSQDGTVVLASGTAEVRR